MVFERRLPDPKQQNRHDAGLGVARFLGAQDRICYRSSLRPVGLVRHPGYVGMITWILSFPLLLTSTWAFFPVGIAIALLLVRTALKDRTLCRKLPGYAEYAERVRSRFLPGV
jgi:protein-S-isoprenylcysteine O-methyltransferase Ste14